MTRKAALRIICIAACALTASCTDSTPSERQSYTPYRAARTLAKVCKDGTKIWLWQGRMYVHDDRQWPDAIVSAPLGEVCQ